jgi:LPXTG-site transpeptidase (sortase) family protein
MFAEFKKLWKYFVFVFLITFLIINWNEVSWVFNYKAVFGIVSDFFQKIQGSAKTLSLTGNKNINFEYSEKENSLEIPKIGIEAPLIVDKNLDDNGVSKALDRGVVYYPGSVLPGEKGQTIILGHSAPPGWPKIKYDWVFTRLNELTEGDEIFVYFDNKKYTYSLKDKIFLERGGEIPKGLTNSENVLVLISCWPPGKDIRRIAVVAE